MMSTAVAAAAILGTTTVLLAVFLVRCIGAGRSLRQQVQALQRRLRPLTDVEKEVAALRAGLDAERRAAEDSAAHAKAETDTLRRKYAVAYDRYTALESEVRGLEENLESISVGLYQPHFTYSDSDSYKAAINGVRAKQKRLIEDGQAAECGVAWNVNNSAREGERMLKQTQKLFLRAFNAESEAAVANVTWNNYTVMRTRMEKAYAALNKLGTVLRVTLTEEYKAARLEELRLVYEAAERKRQEKEEDRRVRAEQREEERVQRELARAQDEAAKDELKYEKALAKARQEVNNALEGEREAMLARIAELEAGLAEAHDRKEKAIAQAQLTKVGHVYVISNIGAFGEGVVKIGMTRRLEPEERIQELGDASVPFPFDLHALIYSENAPELESTLHDRVWDRRINWANDRKEFFRVSVQELSALLQDLGLSAQVAALSEAREYRETQAMQDEHKRQQLATEQLRKLPLPADPFHLDAEGTQDGAAHVS